MRGARPLDNDDIRLFSACFTGTFATRNRGLFMLGMCFLVIVVGCTHTKVSREFSHTMKDGDRVVIEIEYKPKSAINLKGEKIGSYYFHAKHFFLFRPVKNERIYISFYDRKGHLLLKGFTPDGYSINFLIMKETLLMVVWNGKGNFTRRLSLLKTFVRSIL